MGEFSLLYQLRMLILPHMNTCLIMYFVRPLGFDMEWRVNFHARAPERRTALVQLSDERIILLVQISAMRSKYGHTVIATAWC